MAISLVQSKTFTATSGTSETCSFASTTAAGNLLVAFVSDASYSAGAPTITTPSGWSAKTGIDQNYYTEYYVQAFYYVNNPGGLTNVQFVYSKAINGATVIFYEFSGVATSSALDVYNDNPRQAFGTSGSVSATTTANGDLLVGAVCPDAGHGGNSTVTEPSGWSGALHAFDAVGLTEIGSAYDIQASSGSASYAPSWTVSTDAVLLLLAFKAAGAGANSLAAKSRTIFVMRGGLAVPERAHFVSRAGLLVPRNHAQFVTRAGLAESAESRFTTSMALDAPSRSHFKVFPALGALARAVFLSRLGAGTPARATFLSRAALAAAARDTFKIATSATGHALGALAHTVFVSRAGLYAPARSYFPIRVTRMGASGASHFLTRIALLSASSRPRFLTRIGVLAETARSRFTSRASLEAPARSHMLLRAALTNLARAIFRVHSTNTPVLPFAYVADADSALAHTTAMAPVLTHPATAFVPALQGAFSAVLTPFSTSTASLQVKDANGAVLTDLAACACTVTFPDGTTQNFSLGTGIALSNQSYVLTFTTTRPGDYRFQWSVTAADGTTTGTFLDLDSAQF